MKLRIKSMLVCLRKLTGGYRNFLWLQVSEVKDERIEKEKKARQGLGRKTYSSAFSLTGRRDMMGIVSGPLLRVKQGERRANMGLTPSWWNSTPLLHLSTSTAFFNGNRQSFGIQSKFA
ncbi:hypothetical protein SDJN03_05343, partial [Cucurbita argyrosperma subsp. sororia]